MAFRVSRGERAILECVARLIDCQWSISSRKILARGGVERALDEPGVDQKIVLVIVKTVICFVPHEAGNPENYLGPRGYAKTLTALLILPGFLGSACEASLVGQTDAQILPEFVKRERWIAPEAISPSSGCLRGFEVNNPP
jgi:hypothetical protein